MLDWTGKIVGELHVKKITQKQLAEEMGIHPAYVSQLLNGTGVCKEKVPADMPERMENAIKAIVEKR